MELGNNQIELFDCRFVMEGYREGLSVRYCVTPLVGIACDEFVCRQFDDTEDS